MKRLVIKEITNENGIVDKIQIVEQTHRGSKFGKEREKFIHEDFVLVSRGSPEIMGLYAASKFGGKLGLFLRGTGYGSDLNTLRIPDQEWLERMRSAVKVYNTLFNDCSLCDTRHCNSCEFKEK